MRVEFAGACYHVLNRGNYRRALFGGGGAAEAFERVLGEAATRFSWQVHAYLIMSTHFHLAIETAEPNLSEGMKWLQGTWIRRYNALRGLIGRPFQGRYKALLVAPGHAFARGAEKGQAETCNAPRCTCIRRLEACSIFAPEQSSNRGIHLAS